MPTTDDVKIGDFQKPLASVVSPTSSPTKDALDAADRTLDADARRDEAALAPLKSYEERLKDVGVDKAKASRIIDDVLLKGFYSEDIKITSSVNVRLRTRNARDTKRATEIIEAQRMTYALHYNESLSRILLAASLESFGKDTLPHPPMRKSTPDDIEKAFQERIAFVDSLPDPALRVLMTKLAKFDTMVSTVLEEGSIENF